MRLQHRLRTSACSVVRIVAALSISAAAWLSAPVQHQSILLADEDPPVFLYTLGTRGGDPGEFESPADVAIGPNGLLYVADEANYRVQVIDAAGNPVGSPWTGMFEYPDGIAVDNNGTVHVCESGDDNPPRITAHDAGNGTIVHSFGGWSEFSSPCGIAATSVGGTVYVYVADTNNSRIRKFSYDSTIGYAHVASWDGSGTAGQLYHPCGVTVAPDGSIYVADTGNDRIVRFTADGDYLTHWGVRYSQYYGNQIGEFWEPGGVACDAEGNVYVADTNHHCIQKFTADGDGLAMWGTGDGSFNWPAGITVDRYGTIYVADTGNHRIQVFTYPDTPPSFRTKYGTQGTGDGQFGEDRDVAVDPDGNVYVTDTTNDRIQRLVWNEAAGQYEHDETWGAGSEPGEFYSPQGIASDSQGNIYVADNSNARVQKYDGVTWSVIAGSGSSSPTPTDGNFYLVADVAVAPDGTMYVTDTGTNRIQVFTFDPSEGEYTFDHKWGSSGTGDGQFNQPAGIAIDAYGFVYVSEFGGNRIQKFDAAGNYICQWGTEGTGDGQFMYPRGIAVDSEGFVYAVEYMGYRVQKFTGNGIYRTQWGVQGSDDGEFSFPFGVAVDSNDHVYVADTMNHRIQVFGASSTQDVTLDLQADWNLISVPVSIGNNTVAEVFAEIDYGDIYTWIPAPAGGSYLKLEGEDDINPQCAYWVSITTAPAEPVTLTGEPVSVDEWSASLSTGWNMVGTAWSATPIPLNDLDADPSDSILTNAIYWWDAERGTYELVPPGDDLTPGVGYWMACTTDCTATMAPPGA